MKGPVESELAPGISLATDPRRPAGEYAGSWGNPVWLVPPLALREGDAVQVEFGWRQSGRHHWRVARAPGA